MPADAEPGGGGEGLLLPEPTRTLEQVGTEPEKPKRKKKPARISYLRSGLYSKRPELPGPDTEVGRVLADRRQGLIDDLGGADQLSTAKAAMIDLVIRQWAVLDAVDGYLLSLPSLCDKRHRRAWPVVLDRNTIAVSLERTLARLGLERVAKPVNDLVAALAAQKLDAEDGDAVVDAAVAPQEPVRGAGTRITQLRALDVEGRDEPKCR